MMECHDGEEEDQNINKGTEGKQAEEMPSAKPLTKPYRPNMPSASQAP